MEDIKKNRKCAKTYRKLIREAALNSRISFKDNVTVLLCKTQDLERTIELVQWNIESAQVYPYSSQELAVLVQGLNPQTSRNNVRIIRKQAYVGMANFMPHYLGKNCEEVQDELWYKAVQSLKKSNPF